MNTKETLREEWVKKNWKSIEEMVEYGYITKDFCKRLDSLCILGSELKDPPSDGHCKDHPATALRGVYPKKCPPE